MSYVSADARVLLPYEDPYTTRAEDVARWVVVYQELVAFTSDLLERSRSGDAAMLIPIGSGSAERARIGEHILHLRQRLAYWQARHREVVGLQVDAALRTLRYAGHTVRLTRREYQLLSFLLDRPGKAFPASHLAAFAWGDRHLSDEAVRIYVTRVRRRLAQIGAPCTITTRSRQGYCIESDPSPSLPASSAYDVPTAVSDQASQV